MKEKSKCENGIKNSVAIQFNFCSSHKFSLFAHLAGCWRGVTQFVSFVEYFVLFCVIMPVFSRVLRAFWCLLWRLLREYLYLQLPEHLIHFVILPLLARFDVSNAAFLHKRFAEVQVLWMLEMLKERSLCYFIFVLRMLIFFFNTRSKQYLALHKNTKESTFNYNAKKIIAKC